MNLNCILIYLNAENTIIGSNVATMIDEMEYTGCNVAAKSVDLDEVDKESIHLLVFLFMQFLSCSEQVSFYKKIYGIIKISVRYKM